MSEQKPTPFYFWLPTSEAGSRVLLWSLAIIAVSGFLKGYIDVDWHRNPNGAILTVLFFYVALNVFGWYLIFNTARFVYSRINRSERIQTMKETRREMAELKTLRRRSEIKKLKEELGDEAVADGDVPSARKITKKTE